MNNDIVASKFDKGDGVRAVASLKGGRQSRRRPLLLFLRKSESRIQRENAKESEEGIKGRRNSRKKKSEEEHDSDSSFVFQRVRGRKSSKGLMYFIYLFILFIIIIIIKLKGVKEKRN